MEVASAAASIAGLICFAAQAAQVAAQLHGFLTTIAEAPDKIESLARDLLHIHGLLSNVANIGMKLEKTTLVDNLTLSNIEECMTDLKKLDKILQQVQPDTHSRGASGKRPRAWNMVKWTFLEPDVKKLIDQLRPHKQAISLALSSLGRSLDIKAMMSVQSLRDSVNKIIESQDSSSGLGERLDKLGETSEFIRRSLSTISHHIQNSSLAALHENLVTMIRSEITSGVQEALLSTFSGESSSSDLPHYSSRQPEIEKLMVQDTSSLIADTDALLNLNEGENVFVPPPSSQSCALSLNIKCRKYHRYETVLGVLLVFISNETTHSNMFPTAPHGQKDAFEAGFTFIPASWLFKTAFAASFLKYSNKEGNSSIDANLSYYAVVPNDSKIMEYSRCGNVNGIRQLFSQRLATPRDRDGDGRTPLHWAASAGNYETCKFLLENGADSSAINSVNRTPLHWTTLLSCNADIINLLISQGCDPSVPKISGQNSPFSNSAQGRMNSFIRSIVYHDHFIVDLDHVDYQGRTPLMWELYDNIDTSDILTKHGAGATRKDNQGLTALHHTLLCSKEKYKKETVRLLLKSGADPLARSNAGVTPTHIAKHLDVLEEWGQTLSECGFNLEKIGREDLDEAISIATDTMISSLHIGGRQTSGVKRRHSAISSDDANTLIKTPKGDHTFSIDQIPRRIQHEQKSLQAPQAQSTKPWENPLQPLHPPKPLRNNKGAYAVPSKSSQRSRQTVRPYSHVPAQKNAQHTLSSSVPRSVEAGSTAKRQRVSSEGVSLDLESNSSDTSSPDSETTPGLDFWDALVSQQYDWRGGNRILYDEPEGDRWISAPASPCEFKSSYWTG